MRKTILLAVVSALFLFSCKKEHATSTMPSGKKYAITFNVTNFAQKLGAFSIRHKNLASTDTTDLGSYLDVFYYYVFDSNGNVVHRITQDSTTVGFGTVTDSLPAGSYTIIMAAGKSGLMGTPGSSTTLTNSSISYGSINWLDTFFDKFTLNVSNADVSQNVTLKRIVTMIELDVTDTVPANANTITMAVFPEFPNYDFLDQSPGGLPDTLKTTITIPAAAKGKPNFILDKLLGNQLVMFDVTITCRDAYGNIIGSGHSGQVSANPNTRTILRGKLFASSQSQTFQIKADTAWSNTTNQVNFSLRRH